MNLQSNTSLVPQQIRDVLLVIPGPVVRVAVEFADLRSVDPSGYLRGIADNPDFDRVPVIDLPDLDPLVAADAVSLGHDQTRRLGLRR